MALCQRRSRPEPGRGGSANAACARSSRVQTRIMSFTNGTNRPGVYAQSAWRCSVLVSHATPPSMHGYGHGYGSPVRSTDCNGYKRERTDFVCMTRRAAEGI